MTESKAPILTQIQNELKAPKGQWNKFGEYYYRSAEDIEKALKPLLLKYKATLYFTEDVKPVGERVYLVETAHYKDPEGQIKVTGLAREPLTKKKMDDSQLTGSASSYATKYALGKLFLIDDTKDADSMNNNEPKQSYRNYKKPRQRANSAAKNIQQRNVELIAVAKKRMAQYGGGKEKVVDIVGWEQSGDDQAKLFLDDWRKKDKKNENLYQFIIKNNLATKAGA